jgi:hypothetical protein
MRALVVLAIWLLAAAHATAQTANQPPVDGNWLRKGIEAQARMEGGSTKEEDFGDAMAFLGYASGFFAAHRQNNMMFAVLAMAEKSNPKTLTPEAMKLARAFVPLAFLPDNLSPAQASAILRKYLDDNPGKWHESAHLLMLNAFKQAFPVPAR